MRRGVKKQSSATGAIRIISGQWRGRKLPVLDAEGLRPTTDRTKETLFNWLMPYLRDIDCLDCFAGSGSLGLEALSRHAHSVTFIEKNPQASAQLSKNLSTLAVTSEQASVINADALVAMDTLGQEYDLIFLDPPFHQNLIPPMIEKIRSKALLKPGGLVYIESQLQNDKYAVPEQWHCIKQKQTRQVSYRLYEEQ